MPLPTDNRMAAANDSWHELKNVPVGRMLAFTDVEKKHIWAGMLGNEESAPPTLTAGFSEYAPAYWSEIEDQPEVQI
jgi:hypothetical protein